MSSESTTVLHGKYLVAGSTGLMGTNALLRLRDVKNVAVRAAYHAREPFVFGTNITHVQADLKNMDDCIKLCEDIDYVFMFAGILSTAPVLAKDPVSHITDNMIMNAQIMEAAYHTGVKKFVLLSSSTGYPELNKVIDENDMFVGDPPDAYFSVGWMSRYAEVLLRMYATKLKTLHAGIVLRPTTIYGEYESFDPDIAHVLPALIGKVVDRQKPIEVWGTGENSRDMIYSDDVFDACLLSLNQVEGYDVFNIGSGEEVSVNQMLQLVIEIDNFSDSEIAYNASKPTSISKRFINLTKAGNILGFHAKTSIKDGITKMVKWYRNNRNVCVNHISARG